MADFLKEYDEIIFDFSVKLEANLALIPALNYFLGKQDKERIDG